MKRLLDFICGLFGALMVLGIVLMPVVFIYVVMHFIIKYW